MKNSLFKRAFAAAAAVPLALTQCLSVANAVNINNATIALANPTVTADNTQKTEVSVESILFIEPTAGFSDDGDGYVQDGTIWTKDSVWNETISSWIKSMDRTGTLDPSVVYDEIISRAGSYADMAQSATEKVSEVNYSISPDGTITISATIDDITPVFEDKAQSMAGTSLKKLVDKFDVVEFQDVEFFRGVEFAGDIEITIDASSLKDSTVIPGKATFTDKATGKVYNDSEIAEYFLGKLNELQSAAKAEIAYLEAKNELTMAEIDRMIGEVEDYDSSVASIKADYVGMYNDMVARLTDAENMLDNLVNKVTKSVNKGLEQYNRVKTYNNGNDPERFANYAALADAINNNRLFNKALDYADSNLPDKITDKIPDGVPTDPNAVAANNYTQRIFDSLINQLSSKTDKFSFEVTPEDLAQLTDAVTDIEVYANSGVVTFIGKLPDTDVSALDGTTDAATYIENTYDVNVLDVYKKATVVVDFTALDTDGMASVDFQVQRVVEVDQIVTTTTTSTTTTTATTTTTTEDVDGSTTTTTTTEDVDGSTTTTTTTEDVDGSTTTTTTTDDVDGSTTTTV
ncbi:MAG: hypothetical protein NC340_01960, partial [Ruminococcus flavefaciens]|nr:hypothetical protein [Ruminococcus flavefaciens]MCM1228911.1 hypothetical protein [Ruminococcus flavefaciens]